MTIFFHLMDVPVSEKARALEESVKTFDHRSFSVAPQSFKRVPGSPFAYWVSDQLLELFESLDSLEGSGRAARQGGVTGDDFRWLRLWSEILHKDQRDQRNSQDFLTMAKGGAFAHFYADLPLVVHWGRKTGTFWAFTGLPHRPSLQPASFEFYFRPGLTWSLRTQSGLGMRVMPAGCVFGHKGPAVFCKDDDSDSLLSLLALTTSSAFRYFVDLQTAFGSYEVGVIQRTPIPEFPKETREALARQARRAWSLKRTLDTVNETSHAFVLPNLLRSRLGCFDPRAIETELAEIQSTIDDLAFGAYNLEGNDRETIETWASSKSASFISDATEEGDAEADEDTADTLLADTTPALHSWAVGVTFGRFDIRLATGERQPPPEPGPFDPLPTRSPGMIPESDEARFPPRPLLVDDPGHPLDLAAQAGDVLERVGFTPESPDSFRRWLARDFFPLHIKMYSKSRRKAPIYWQLATPSASYSVWLYIHAFSRDVLYKVQEIVELKLRHEERKLESLRADFGASPTAAQRKELESQESFVEELRAFLEEVKRVAPLWNPDLDDGVIINFSPLWRLVPHHKPWQKELKAIWDELCAGKYAWAHLSMHLWPERVVPKCAADRSLAIAHGLEDVFWMEDEDGKWKPRPIPARPVEELVSERTSQTVKAALKGLLEAPAAPSGGRGRGRGRRGAAA